MADEYYWTYHAATPTPTLEQAKEIKAVRDDMTEKQWTSLTPGMRREIVLSVLKKSS